jgi:hypothetical protein
MNPYKISASKCSIKLSTKTRLAVGGDVAEATTKLQRAADEINDWSRQWLIKRNEDNSTHVNFNNKTCLPTPIIVNDKTTPYSHTAKYLDMTLDAKLRWKVHVKKKREELGLNYKHMHWLMRRKSGLSTQNKLVL